MNKVLDETIRKALENEDYQKIMGKASSKFSYILSKDELESCKIEAMWKALAGYDKSRGTKFTSYLYRGVYLECKTHVKFIMGGRRDAVLCHPNIGKEDKTFLMIEIRDELSNMENGGIISDYYFDGLSLGEMSEKYGVSKQTIGIRKKKALNLLKSRLF